MNQEDKDYLKIPFLTIWTIVRPSSSFGQRGKAARLLACWFVTLSLFFIELYWRAYPEYNHQGLARE